MARILFRVLELTTPGTLPSFIGSFTARKDVGTTFKKSDGEMDSAAMRAVEAAIRGTPGAMFYCARIVALKHG